MAASGRTRSLTEALWWAALPGSILFCFLQVTEHVAKGAIGFDSHAYWLAARMPESWYLLAPRLKDAYLYSPAFAELLWPFGQLPWPVFQGLWAAFGAVLLFWLLKPLGWRKGLTLAPFFVTELMLGNVYILFAAALVVGLTRFPGAFAIFAITKLSPSVCVSVVRCSSGVDEGGDRGRHNRRHRSRLRGDQPSGLGRLGSVPPDLDGRGLGRSPGSGGAQHRGRGLGGAHGPSLAAGARHLAGLSGVRWVGSARRAGCSASPPHRVPTAISAFA